MSHSAGANKNFSMEFIIQFSISKREAIVGLHAMLKKILKEEFNNLSNELKGTYKTHSKLPLTCA